MSLHNGIDTIAWVSLGFFSKEAGVSQPTYRASIYASLGLIEGATSYPYALSFFGFGLFEKKRGKKPSK